MVRTVRLFAVGIVLILPACYHAIIETGRPPSPQVIDQPWASGWIYGLVPPKTVEASAKCPNGVSKVETQLSFLNQLVQFLTLGIYTPMSIKVTCAAGGRASIPAGAAEIQLGQSPTPMQVQEALSRAAVQSLKSGAPVYVEF